MYNVFGRIEEQTKRHTTNKKHESEEFYIKLLQYFLSVCLQYRNIFKKISIDDYPLKWELNVCQEFQKIQFVR